MKSDAAITCPDEDYGASYDDVDAVVGYDDPKNWEVARNEQSIHRWTFEVHRASDRRRRRRRPRHDGLRYRDPRRNEIAVVVVLECPVVVPR